MPLIRMSANKLKIALVQLAVGKDKSVNVTRAAQHVKEAAGKGAKLVVLPECFNSPYGTQYFGDYAEEIPGPSTKALSDVAKETGVFLLGGSIPEKKDGKLYNTATAYSPTGEMVMRYSKMHLFDIDIPGKVRFQESEVLTPGESYGTFEVAPELKIGVGICYDIRFAELGMLLARKGCNLLLYPGAFNMTTGPVHWELLQKCRALDNQVYVAAASPARDETASYIAWGHSTVINPWGDVVAKTEAQESIVYADLDMNYLKEVREQVPITKQRREDMYMVENKKD